MRRFHYLFALSVLASASAFSAQVKNEDEAIRLAIDAIHKFHLTALSDECGLIDVIEKPSYFELVVHERHTPACGGTPETGPRLFNVRVRKRDGQLTSDVYDGVTFQLVDHRSGRARQIK
jgi:hypothetical protein